MVPTLVDAVRRRFPTPEGPVPHEAHDFLHEFGSVHMALLHAIVFVPTFVEVDGSVLLTSLSSDACARFRYQKSKQKTPIGELEASFNWIEVPYLFANRNCSEEEAQLLAEMIAESWRGRLKMLYNKRDFLVRVLTPEETGSVVGVQFYELR